MSRLKTWLNKKQYIITLNIMINVTIIQYKVLSL